MAATGTLRFLKTRSLVVSASSSDTISTTRLRGAGAEEAPAATKGTASRGTGVEEAPAAAKGTTSRGAEGAGKGATGAMFGARVEAPTPVVASSRRAKTSASFARFSSFSTMPTPITRRDENLVRQN